MLRSVEIECVAARVFRYRRCIYTDFIELRVRKFIIDLIFGRTNNNNNYRQHTKKLNMAMQH